MKLTMVHQKKHQLVALLVAGVATLVLLAQLFHFERFPALLAQSCGVSLSVTATLAIMLAVGQLFGISALLVLSAPRFVLRAGGVVGIMAYVLLIILEIITLLHGGRSVAAGPLAHISASLATIAATLALTCGFIWVALKHWKI